jgi:hypothetical protein
VTREGFEPSTLCLKGRYSAIELPGHDLPGLKVRYSAVELHAQNSGLHSNMGNTHRQRRAKLISPHSAVNNPPM